MDQSIYNPRFGIFVPSKKVVEGEVKAHVMGLLGYPSETYHTLDPEWFEGAYHEAVPQARDILTDNIMLSKSTLDLAREYIEYIGVAILRDLIEGNKPSSPTTPTTSSETKTDATPNPMGSSIPPVIPGNQGTTAAPAI